MKIYSFEIKEEIKNCDSCPLKVVWGWNEGYRCGINYYTVLNLDDKNRHKDCKLKEEL